MNMRLVWESLKAPARQILLALYAFLINQLFSLVAKYLGFEFTAEQKLQLLGYGVPVVWAILSWIDRILHKLGKQEEEASKDPKAVSLLTRGISRF